MNITLSAPPATVTEVREWAEQNGTSLNEYIRDCLEFKAGEIKALRLKRAQEFYEHALEQNHDGLISTQVMSEFVNVVFKKGIAHLDQLDKWISFFYPLLATEVTMDIVRNAVAIMNEYGIQFYDAQIVATAEKLGCHEIVSEDLNEKQLYHGMSVVNPFK